MLTPDYQNAAEALEARCRKQLESFHQNLERVKQIRVDSIAIERGKSYIRSLDDAIKKLDNHILTTTMALEHLPELDLHRFTFRVEISMRASRLNKIHDLLTKQGIRFYYQKRSARNLKTAVFWFEDAEDATYIKLMYG